MVGIARIGLAPVGEVNGVRVRSLMVFQYTSVLIMVLQGHALKPGGTVQVAFSVCHPSCTLFDPVKEGFLANSTDTGLARTCHQKSWSIDKGRSGDVEELGCTGTCEPIFAFS